MAPENQNELSCQLFPAMLAGLCTYLDDLSTVWAFHGEILLVNLLD